MKAIVYEKYGPPDVLQLREKEKPVPGDNEILVKIHAASVNPADWHTMRGKPFLIRLTGGLFSPKNPILGIDIAGEVEAVGKNITEFKPRDAVFGDCGWGGGFAEYVCVSAERIVLKPENVTFDKAASVSVAAITALQALRDHGKIQPGQKVLINGASGGVGTFAVQMAKYFGAEVTGVCSSRNLDLVRSLGAHQVIDYTREDFTRTGQGYDLIIDNVANHSVLDLKRALNPGGNCVIVGFTSLPLLVQHIALGPLLSTVSSKKVGSMGIANPNRKDMLFLSELLETGKLKPVIDKQYPLSEAAEAIRYVEAGHARGKVVLNVRQTH